MMKNKLIAKLTVVALIGTLTTVSLAPSVEASAKTFDNKIEIKSVSQNELEQMQNNVYNYLVLNEDGTIGLSKAIPKSLSDEYKLDGLYKHFEKLNEKVKNGEISINKDFSINQRQARGGQSYETWHWWGEELGYSYDFARTTITKLKNIAIGGATAGSIGGAMANILLTVSGALLYGYCTMLSNSMEDENDHNSERGIVVDINWSTAYSVYSQ